jgi:hypothetical protein
VIFSVVYLVVRCLLDCLMVLARREVSKDAELLVLRHDLTCDMFRPLERASGADLLVYRS